jgi:hypothetical protein
MSALPLKADIDQHGRDVSFVAKSGRRLLRALPLAGVLICGRP